MTAHGTARRSRRVAFVIIALATAFSLVAVAQPKKTAKPAPAKVAPAKPAAPQRTKAPAKTTDEADASAAPAKDTAKEPADSSSRETAKASETKTVDGGQKVFRFGELEVEGRLKSPQIVYFLRRVRAEFAASDLGHRSFMSELGETKNEPAF